MNREAFHDAVVDGYEHLYNMPRLQENPLLLLWGGQSPPSVNDARRLNQLLIDTIDLLNPGEQAPVTSREWRRHRLLTMRYIDGITPQQIADQLAISLRHYYREHKEALEALENLLWQRYETTGDFISRKNQRDDLIRQEAALVSHQQTGADFEKVLGGVLDLLAPICQSKAIQINARLLDNPLWVNVPESLLRQILVELLNTVLQTAKPELAITLACELVDERLIVQTTFAPKDHLHLKDRIETVRQLCELWQVELVTERNNTIELHLRIQEPRTILIVDDNDDFIQLVSRYLKKHGYHVVIARTGQETIRLARQLDPFAITLDVMIPEPDGWTVLQTLHNSQDTLHIPIIVTTVLSAQELAMALGAFAFLNKPISEAALMTTLNQIDTSTIA